MTDDEFRSELRARGWGFAFDQARMEVLFIHTSNTELRAARHEIALGGWEALLARLDAVLRPVADKAPEVAVPSPSTFSPHDALLAITDLAGYHVVDAEPKSMNRPEAVCVKALANVYAMTDPFGGSLWLGPGDHDAAKAHAAVLAAQLLLWNAGADLGDHLELDKALEAIAAYLADVRGGE